MGPLARRFLLALAATIASLLLAVTPGWTSGLPIADGAVVLKLDRATYAVGEDIRFTETNGRGETIFLPCTDPWVVHRSIDGQWYRVEYHPCDSTILSMDPGAVYQGIWQSGAPAGEPGLTPIEAGYYRIDMVAFSCHDSLDNCRRILTSGFFWLD